MSDAMQLPQYMCHKKVWALKISVVEYLPGNKVALQFHDTRFGPIIVSVENKPKPSNDWYYVVYPPDGYFSFSPEAEFEAGYTLVQQLSVEDVKKMLEHPPRRIRTDL